MLGKVEDVGGAGLEVGGFVSPVFPITRQVVLASPAAGC